MTGVAFALSAYAVHSSLLISNQTAAYRFDVGGCIFSYQSYH